MLELSFVRDHLAKVEQMLRSRGMNPDVVLKDFREVDGQRLQAISAAETLKAHRNRLSQEIAGMKKSGQDAAQLMADTKDMRVQIQELEKAAEEYDTRLNEVLVGLPNVPHDSVPEGKSAEDNIEVRSWGTKPG